MSRWESGICFIPATASRSAARYWSTSWMSSRFSPVAASSDASNSSTSPKVACVPSILLDSTASCVVSGESSTWALGTACSTPSYRATAALAGPIRGTSRS